MTMEDIKDAYYTGVITLSEAKKRLFEYAPHPDAVESNNEVLRAWEYAKKLRYANKTYTIQQLEDNGVIPKV